VAIGDHQELLRLDDAAAVLGMSRRTLDRRIAAGAIAVFRDDRIVAVPAAEIARYIATHLVRRTPGRHSPFGAAQPMSSGERLWD
jgi:predicted DNA-binding transcriptional regulator AlpA